LAAQAASPTYGVAFEANTAGLYTRNSATSALTNTYDGMYLGTNPAIAGPGTATSSSTSCAAANNCTPQTFADALPARGSSPSSA